ncbi:MAG: hypothetical protein COY40_06990 [Alphaproteobacteria bacterium CG_4_10_14_0_8_um_filter_53_9]|nr:MAG: hypothetical protein COY40_06990 [Alphaproteobacteria bacterium CG_4_10_14_0_8_um_filter_53_9]
MGGRLTREEQVVAKASLAPFSPRDEDWAHPCIELELGCGNGLALLARAKISPDTLFVANDLFLPGLLTLKNHLQQSGFTNVRIAAEDGRDVLAVIPPHRLHRVLIPFPDPWPKAAHHKRRIVQPELLDLIFPALKPDGELWVVTDWPSYAYHAISVLHTHPLFALQGTTVAAAECKPAADAESFELGPQRLARAPDWWQTTKYQEKAKMAGRGTWYISATPKKPK